MSLQYALLRRLSRGPAELRDLVSELSAMETPKRGKGFQVVDHRNPGLTYRRLMFALEDLRSKGLVLKVRDTWELGNVARLAVAVAERRPLATMQAAAERLVARLSPHALRLEIAGSIRRRQETVKDVELVALVPEERDLLGAPTGADMALTSALLAGAEKCCSGSRHTSVVVDDPEHGPVKVDLFQTCDPACWGMLFFIRTGSANFVQRYLAAWKAATNGECVDLQLRRQGVIVPTPEEPDVFRVLDEARRAAGGKPVPFVPPERRTPLKDASK